MAWTYSDWTTQSTASAKLTRLDLHLKEVADYLQKMQDGNIAGQTYRRFDLVRYQESLQKERVTVAKDAAAATLGAGSSRPIKVFGIRMGRPAEE